MKSNTAKTAALFALTAAFDLTNGQGLRGSSSQQQQQQERNLIINGDEVERDYPYYALMAGNTLCGGTVIGPRLVLGAAHCADADDQFRIGVQEYNATSDDNGDDVVYAKIKSRHIHPLNEYMKVPHDIMLFELEDDVYLTDYVKLDNFHKGSPESTDFVYQDSEFTVIGFGDTDPDENVTEISTVKHEITIPYVPFDECSEIYTPENETTSKIIPGMMCAGATEYDSCQGDSGGPLLSLGDTWEDDILTGVVSWGDKCGTVGTPGVYASVSYYYDWIVQTICTEFPIGVGPEYIKCDEYNGNGGVSNIGSIANNNNNIINGVDQTGTTTESISRQDIVAALNDGQFATVLQEFSPEVISISPKQLQQLQQELQRSPEVISISPQQLQQLQQQPSSFIETAQDLYSRPETMTVSPQQQQPSTIVGIIQNPFPSTTSSIKDFFGWN